MFEICKWWQYHWERFFLEILHPRETRPSNSRWWVTWIYSFNYIYGKKKTGSSFFYDNLKYLIWDYNCLQNIFRQIKKSSKVGEDQTVWKVSKYENFSFSNTGKYGHFGHFSRSVTFPYPFNKYCFQRYRMNKITWFKVLRSYTRWNQVSWKSEGF